MSVFLHRAQWRSQPNSSVSLAGRYAQRAVVAWSAAAPHMGPDGRPWTRGASPVNGFGLPGRVVEFTGSNTAAFERPVTVAAQTRFFAAAVFQWQSGAANNFPQLLGMSSVNSSFRVNCADSVGINLGLVKGGVFAFPTVPLVSGEWYAMITSHDQSTGAYYIAVKPFGGGAVTRATANNTAASSGSDGISSVGTSRKDYAGTWNGAIALAYASFEWVPETIAAPLLDNPWALFRPQESLMFYAPPAGVTLSAATVFDITETTATPRYTVAFA